MPCALVLRCALCMLILVSVLNWAMQLGDADYPSFSCSRADLSCACIQWCGARSPVLGG